MPFNRYAAMRKLHTLGAAHGYDHDELRQLAVNLFRLPQDKQSLTAALHAKAPASAASVALASPKVALLIQSGAKSEAIVKEAQKLVRCSKVESPSHIVFGSCYNVWFRVVVISQV